jgi:hypothetical protein
MIRRPLEAFLLCVQMFGERVEAKQMFDGAVSRFVHTLSRPSSGSEECEEAAASCEVKTWRETKSD